MGCATSAKEKRSNETHAATSDPDARLFRKGDGQSSRLCFMGHALMENRNGLIVDAAVSHATGTAEREMALLMIQRTRRTKGRITLGADKAYDVAEFITTLKGQKVTPHTAINGCVSCGGKMRKTAIDGRTTRHPGYSLSQRCRKRIEEAFGWAKTIGGAAKLKVRGLGPADTFFTFRMIAYNLVRIPKLLAQAA